MSLSILSGEFAIFRDREVNVTLQEATQRRNRCYAEKGAVCFPLDFDDKDIDEKVT